LGLALLVLALLGPILWAWYLTWGFVVLAAVAVGRLQRVVIVLAIVETFLGVSALKGMAETLWDSGVLLDLLLVVGIVAVMVVPLSHRTDAAGRRLWRLRARSEITAT